MTVIVDADGRTLAVGTRVTDGHTSGHVGAITAPDADWEDDAERAVLYGPRLFVVFDDGTDDTYTCSPEGHWFEVSIYDMTFVCDEVSAE